MHNNATCDNVASKPPNIVAVIIPKNVRMMSQGNRLVAVFTTESFVESISDTPLNESSLHLPLHP